MKKTNCIMALGALILSGCAQDSVIGGGSPNSPNAEGTPMTFNVSKANQSRATGLETAHLDFGVWGYKTSDADGGKTATTAQNVFPNYLVGFQNSTMGYFITGGTDNVWIYEGLGRAQSYTFHDMSGNEKTGADLPKSNNENQYLKYWDDSYTYTYFYAYAPYCYDATPANRVQFDPTSLTMTFPNGTEAWKYACYKANNSSHANVPLHFKAFASQIRLAFYNTIPGYDVTIIDYSTANDNVKGVAFVPTAVTENTAPTADVYSQGSYVSGGKPKIGFSVDASGDLQEAAVQYDGIPTTTQDALKWGANTTDFSPVTMTGTDKIYSTYQSIQPQTNTAGFTLNVSFKLEAKDTDEEIYVRGARVFVPANRCNWLTNHSYTYVFKITGNVPGTTGTFTETSYGFGPNPTPALYPIVFEDVTIADMVDQEIVTEVNSIILDKQAITIQKGKTETLTARTTLGTVTWYSSNADVATVSNGVVTAAKAGTALITAVCTDAHGVEYYATCTVTVKDFAIDPATATIAAGSTQTLTAKLDGEEIPTGVVWTSSDEAKATVDETGVVTAVAAGEATITATYEADGTIYTATCVVNPAPGAP